MENVSFKHVFYEMGIFKWQVSVTKNVLICLSFQHVINVDSVVLAPFTVSGNHWELFYHTARNIVYVNPLGENTT